MPSGKYTSASLRICVHRYQEFTHEPRSRSKGTRLGSNLLFTGATSFAIQTENADDKFQTVCIRFQKSLSEVCRSSCANKTLRSPNVLRSRRTHVRIATTLSTRSSRINQDHPATERAKESTNPPQGQQAVPHSIRWKAQQANQAKILQ